MERESLVLIQVQQDNFLNNGMGLFGEGVIVGIADSMESITLIRFLEIRTEVREL